METRYYRTGDPFWRSTTKFWMRLFGINFAIGVATGLILEFEFGTNWSNYSNFVGDIFGAPLAIEGIMAFFLESTFVAVMFFGWDKVSRGFHLSATWLTAIGANLSALWILVANSWMQSAVGCCVSTSPRCATRWIRSGTYSSRPWRSTSSAHTVTSSFLLAAIFVMGVSAWYLLRGRHRRMARSSIALASVFGLVFALVAAFSGDRSGAIAARVQPMKLAAMEALYDGEEGAPLTVVGLLRPEGQRTCDDDAFYFKIGIPKLLSLMSFRSADAFVPGINDLVYGNEERGILSTAEKMSRGRRAIDQLGRYHEAREKGDEAAMHEVERLFDASTPEGAAFLRDYYAYFGYGYLRSPQETVPNVPLVFYSFRVMVGAGCFFILLCAVVWWLNRRDRLAGKRWLLRVMILSIPLAYLALAGGLDRRRSGTPAVGRSRTCCLPACRGRTSPPRPWPSHSSSSSRSSRCCWRPNWPSCCAR